MELTAVLKALEYSKLYFNEDEQIIIYTDSAYIANCFKDKWYKKWIINNWRNSSNQPVANQDLWIKILNLYNPNIVSISKVNGHSNNEYNNMADKLAVNARKEK